MENNVKCDIDEIQKKNCHEEIEEEFEEVIKGSIIVTQINKFGIIFAADSNISNLKVVKREADKIFKIPKLDAAICTAGSYSIGKIPLDDWLPGFIKDNEYSYSNIGEFAKLISRTLTDVMVDEEKRYCFIAHIAGYDDCFPEMWHVRNTTLDNNGKYLKGGDYFEYTEDLKNRDWKKNNLQEVFEQNGYQLYVNGFTPGRVSFNILIRHMETFFKTIWGVREYKFRGPKSLLDHETLIRTYIDIVTKCFILSDYVPKYIGGETKSYRIEKPGR